MILIDDIEPYIICRSGRRNPKNMPPHAVSIDFTIQAGWSSVFHHINEQHRSSTKYIRELKERRWETAEICHWGWMLVRYSMEKTLTQCENVM